MTRERRAQLEARIIAERKSRRRDPVPLDTQARGLNPMREAFGTPAAKRGQVPVTWSPWCGSVHVNVAPRDKVKP